MTDRVISLAVTVVPQRPVTGLNGRGVRAICADRPGAAIPDPGRSLRAELASVLVILIVGHAAILLL
jgi:hypothetical protein